jgi:hypothetical protein
MKGNAATKDGEMAEKIIQNKGHWKVRAILRACGAKD